MRKGLTVTLMTVALAILAMRAMAEAPVISEIPSPVVGDGESVTPANVFVFPDAFNLDLFVTDDTKRPSQIQWSYETATAPIYLINGVPVLSGTDNPIAPPPGKVINTQVLGGETNPDGQASTITIRNNHLSPLGVFYGDYIDPGAAGVVDSETQWVTFYASDGSTRTEASVLFYTANDELDQLSGAAHRVYSDGTPATSGDWAYSFMGGSATSSTVSNAICMNVGQIGINWAFWSGRYGQLPLVKNSVYRIRALVNGSAATAGTTPFWDLLVNNFDGTHGLNAYGANYFFLDNTGGANAALAGAGTTFEMWWNPTCVSNAKWNDTEALRPGPFADQYAADRDAFIQFRVLDVNNSPGITADNDFGSLCMKSLTIDRYELGTLAVAEGGGGLVNVTAITNALAGSGNTRFHGVNGSGTFANNALTIAPIPGTTDVDDGRRAMIATVEPGNDTIPFSTNPSDSAEVLDNFPVPMDPQTLYEIHFGLQAPTAADEASPPDVFWLGADILTNETIYMTYVTSNVFGTAMPAYSAAGTPQDYKCFFYSNGGTAASNPAWWKQFRPRFMIGNAEGLGLFQATGAVTMNYYKVDKIRLP